MGLPIRATPFLNVGFAKSEVIVQSFHSISQVRTADEQRDRDIRISCLQDSNPFSVKRADYLRHHPGEAAHAEADFI